MHIANLKEASRKRLQTVQFQLSDVLEDLMTLDLRCIRDMEKSQKELKNQKWGKSGRRLREV